MKYYEQITSLFLLFVVVILSALLFSPVGMFASTGLVIPVAPPLVRIADNAVAESFFKPEATVVEASELAAPSIANIPAELQSKLAEISLLHERRLLLERKRAGLKLDVEHQAVVLGELLPAENMINIYLDRVELIYRFGEMKGFEQRLSKWQCATPAPKSP
jgi:hypothetical protein